MTKPNLGAAHDFQDIVNQGNNITLVLEQAGIKPSSTVIHALLWIAVSHTHAGVEEESADLVRKSVESYIDVDRALSQARAYEGSRR